jgi:hypothetical protein
MRARLVVVLVTCSALLPLTLSAQMRGNGRVSGISQTPQGPTPPPGAPVAPPSGPGSGPGRSFRPLPQRSSAPPSHPLPVPFAGTVPDPFIQPAPSSSRMQPSTSRDVFRSRRWTYAPRYGRWSAVSGGYAAGYGAYYDAGGYYGSLPTTQAPADLPQGRLALFVTPATTQVYVDGFYVGTVADFQDRGLWLESGPRRIELRADGYQTETFDVRIDEERSTEYRRDLTSTSARSDAPRVAANPKTFYVIPGCYAGDTPPQKNRLPDGCLTRNVRTIPPVVSRLTPR